MYTTNHSHSCGVIIMIVDKWKSNFVTWKINPFHDVVYILLEIGGIYFGIINIYASNKA